MEAGGCSDRTGADRVERECQPGGVGLLVVDGDGNYGTGESVVGLPMSGIARPSHVRAIAAAALAALTVAGCGAVTTIAPTTPRFVGRQLQPETPHSLQRYQSKARHANTALG